MKTYMCPSLRLGVLADPLGKKGHKKFIVFEFEGNEGEKIQVIVCECDFVDHLKKFEDIKKWITHDKLPSSLRDNKKTKFNYIG